MIQVSALASGSSGNAILVKVDGVFLLLDAGLNYKQLVKRLDVFSLTMQCIDGIFATHAHQDHLRAIPMIQKKHPGLKCSLPGDYQHGEPLQVSPCSSATIIPFVLDHDDECHGFRVDDGQGNSLVYITDTGTIPCDSLSYMIDPSILIVEANYDATRLISGPYPDDLKIRVSETHMENKQARELVELLVWDGLKYVFGHHLSAKNNDPELAKFELECGVKVTTAQVIIAEQITATKMVTVM